MLEKKKSQIITDFAFCIIKGCPQNIFCCNLIIIIALFIQACYHGLILLDGIWTHISLIGMWPPSCTLCWAVSEDTFGCIPLSYPLHTLSCRTLLTLPPQLLWNPTFSLLSCCLCLWLSPHYFLPGYSINIIVMGMLRISPSKQFCDIGFRIRYWDEVRVLSLVSFWLLVELSQSKMSDPSFPFQHHLLVPVY